MKPTSCISGVMASWVVLLCATVAAWGQGPASKQTETDEYTRYELLSPESASFAIRYEVTATAAGAMYYFNPVRKGSVARDESVLDVMTGQRLRFEVVSGEEALKDPLMKSEDASVDYIKVHLARPVPADGQARLLILKTYKDAKSYYRAGDTIVFNRPLSIPRNSVVLPAGYELVACNVPSQILTEHDGRIAISFMNSSGAEAPLIVKAKLGAQTGPAAAPRAPGLAKDASIEGWPEVSRMTEQAHVDPETVYQLQQPETHSFRLIRDYTWDAETAGFAFSVNSGIKVENLSAYVLDTGDKLSVRVMTGAEIAATRNKWAELVDPKAHVVEVSGPAMKPGQSLRVRVLETAIAPANYRLNTDELVFDRTLQDPRNAVVLPDGWYLMASSIPATVTQMADGRIRLDFWNGHPNFVNVLIKAKRCAH